jgi:HD-GYP domain-containing protein (c-di-GMP phosphodiesterase class II)
VKVNIAPSAFRRRAALRIALVTLTMAAIASPLSWFVALESTEASIVALALEESRRLLLHHDAINLIGDNAGEHAAAAAKTIVGGLFDIAEIYNSQGQKLAESMTRNGTEVEALLPAHEAPAYRVSSYESIRLEPNLWLLRVFVPLRVMEEGEASPITGYFEGVRVVPSWQKNQIRNSSLRVAVMVGLASVLCGLALYPVVVHLSSDNERKTREVLDSHLSMMEALGRTIAKRDSDTGAHNYRVAWMATCIAEKLDLSGGRMQALIAGSFLHDVGKIGIPDAILLKPGSLDDSEFSIMRSHVQQGEEIVVGMGWLDGASAVVSGHHEKWDGSGYPRGLSGHDISLEARIFAIADVFDALCSKRPYKEPKGFEEAISILSRGSGSHFDPDVLAVFLPMAREIYNRMERSSEDDVRLLLAERVRHHFGL